MQDLASFIKENSHSARSVINKSRFRKMLDDSDIEETIHMSLWRVYDKFDPNRASLFRFIVITVNSYILRLVQKKKKIKEKEISIGEMDFAENSENITEYFTESEWSAISPLLDCTYRESAKKRNLTIRKYKTLLRAIGNNVKSRL